MRVAILGGAGAMGGLFGAHLSLGGAEVILVDVSRAAIDEINGKGLIVEAKDGTATTYRLAATDQPATVGPVDLIVNFVKCYHTQAAIRGAKNLIGPDTVVLTLQNGWGNARTLAEEIGEHRVLVGLTYNSATLLAPGRVRHTAPGITHLGELSGVVTERLRRIERLFAAGGLETVATTRTLDEIWRKLSLNACALPNSALLRFEAHKLVELPPSKELVRLILREVVAVARAKGVDLDFEERWEAITAALGRAKGAKASMLQDVEAGRRTEIEVINGAISAAGRETGIPTPVNDTLVLLVQALQSAYLAEK